MSSDDRMSQELAAYIRKHPEVLSLLPKGHSDELDALRKRFSDGLSVSINGDFMRRHGALPARNCKPRARPTDIAEYRHRMRCSAPDGTSASVPLVVDADWFAESCVGIHSVRVIELERQDLSKMYYGIEHAEIVHKGTRVEWGDPTDPDLSVLFKLFARGELGRERRFGDLPFASSFEPDRCWLPVSKEHPYSILLELIEPIKSFEVEFTCMLARSACPPECGPNERILLPRVEREVIEASIDTGLDSFSFPLPCIENCVGVALSVVTHANGMSIWCIEEARMLDEGGECVAKWDNADLYRDPHRKFGDADAKVMPSAGLCEFGPFMRDASRATTITRAGNYSLRIKTGFTNSSEKPMACKLHLYMFRHMPLLLSE
ncbi:hypothetical protein QKT49_gp140 [Acanthamoeba castellanii medusavirus]|uniref:Uncharacterized protein n=1 Tax=Acanthamoeba castellanii medusavirus J1 TaxID=3114988 RepID=A0A3T1CWR7_9VIRU|nr:hypothetical protein QKT49_gp140 [Acanthamoeba castellanii medusavirus]BBI30280.1 hypothetical protein [Acanthamoeba castellanii medusavirus J1]